MLLIQWASQWHFTHTSQSHGKHRAGRTVTLKYVMILMYMIRIWHEHVQKSQKSVSLPGYSAKPCSRWDFSTITRWMFSQGEGGWGEFVVLGFTSKQLLWHVYHIAMVCHTAVLLELSATTPAYHAVSPTVAAIFISRLCVCCLPVARERAVTSGQEGGRAKMTRTFKNIIQKLWKITY